MNDNQRLETFLTELAQRPLPAHPMERIKLLARELADGAVQGLWGVAISQFRGVINEEALNYYLAQRWDGNQPSTALLIANGYLSNSSESQAYLLSKAAFDLLDEAEPANIFISYRRSESSAFALLVLARLKMAGLEPFLDLSLVPGEDWEAGLQERIGNYDYFIVLLSKSTLRSEVVLKEITWAAHYGLTIIPIWHNGFGLMDIPGEIPQAVSEMLSRVHTIRVLEESALAYNNAIVELLNRFGITP